MHFSKGRVRYGKCLPKSLCAWCYLVCVALWLLFSLGLAVTDAVLYATGVLHTQTLTLDDTGCYRLADLAREGDTLVSLSGDPQLLVEPGQRVRTVSVVLKGAEDAEKDLYYHLPGQGYTQRLRVWPTVQAADAFFYELPLWAGQNFRLDVCDRTGVTVTSVRIVLNEPQPLSHYLIPSLWVCLWLAVLPGLLACGLDLVFGLAHGRAGR